MAFRQVDRLRANSYHAITGTVVSNRTGMPGACSHIKVLTAAIRITPSCFILNTFENTMPLDMLLPGLAALKMTQTSLIAPSPHGGSFTHTLHRHTVAASPHVAISWFVEAPTRFQKCLLRQLDGRPRNSHMALSARAERRYGRFNGISSSRAMTRFADFMLHTGNVAHGLAQLKLGGLSVLRYSIRKFSKYIATRSRAIYCPAAELAVAIPLSFLAAHATPPDTFVECLIARFCACALTPLLCRALYAIKEASLRLKSISGMNAVYYFK